MTGAPSSETGKSGAIRSSRVPTPVTVLVMSKDATVREGWARHFERIGRRVIRCAGPENTSCALERSPHCPLHEDANIALYDAGSMTDTLTARLFAARPRLPIALARDQTSISGEHRPIIVR